MFLFFCITVFGMSGIVAWPNRIDHIGYFKLAGNPWGIALYEDGLHRTIQFNGFQQTSMNGSTITLSRNTHTPASIEFSRDDIIFTANGDLYTESRIQEIDTISFLSGLPLTRMGTDNRVATISSIVYIVNPQIRGMVSVQFPSGTHSQIHLDKKTIEFTTDVTHITAHVYEDIPTFTTRL